MKNVRQMMLDVHIDEESDNSQQDNNKIKIESNYPNYSQTRNKYESTALTRGLFSQTEEDINYNICPKKKQEQSSKVQTEEIRISHRSSHLLHQMEFESSESDQEKCEDDQEQPKKEINQPETALNKEFLIAPLGSKQLLNIVFDESDEEDGESTKKNRIQKQDKIESVTYKDIDKYPNQKTNICQFIKNELQKDTRAKFTISRDQSGFNILWPEFMLILNENGKKCAYAKKMMGNTTANYYITVEKGEQNVESDNFIGKMRSNFMGSALNIFSSGVSPKKALMGQNIRYIQATIKYIGQLMPKKPREFEVFILKDQYKYLDLQGAIKNEQIGLDVLYNRKENETKIWYFKNRRPIYSEQTKGFILNFAGRVQKPSIKNFILEDPKDSREVMMLGKTTEDIFRMEASYPLKPYIALGISLANFESKYIGD